MNENILPYSPIPLLPFCSPRIFPSKSTLKVILNPISAYFSLMDIPHA